MTLAAAGCDGGSREPFDPAVHGFRFRNYGAMHANGEPAVNLTATEMRRIFGDGVCDAPPTADGSCALTSVARQWMTDLNKITNGGHCEGMAVLSARFHARLSDPLAFGGARVIDLAPTPELQREIAYWFMFQIFEPIGQLRADGTNAMTTPGRVGGDPRELARRLRAAIEAGEHHTIMFFNKTEGGRLTDGHAVTPYTVDDGEQDGELLIRVYDNNFPDDASKVIRVLADGSWEYRTAADPNAPEADYRGTVDSETLLTVDVRLRAGTHPCFFCGNVSMSSGRVVSASTGNLLVTDAEGRRTGTMGGAFVNEIPGAGVQAIVGMNVEDDVPPLLAIPGSVGDLTITLSGQDEMQQSSLGVAGAGYYLGVEDIALAADQVDNVELGGDYPTIVYTTSSMQTAAVVLAVETERAGWIVLLRSRGQSDGQRVAAELQLEDGTLAFGFTGNDAEVAFDFVLYRLDAGTELEFEASDVRVPAGSQLQLDYATFDADGATLTLRIDVDGDGVVDDEVNLADQS